MTLARSHSPDCEAPVPRDQYPSSVSGRLTRCPTDRSCLLPAASPGRRCGPAIWRRAGELRVTAAAAADRGDAVAVDRLSAGPGFPPAGLRTAQRQRVRVHAAGRAAQPALPVSGRRGGGDSCDF